MNFTKIFSQALTIEGIRNFFNVYDENNNLSRDQILGSVIQLVIFVILIITIGCFLL